jgi:hypothetical protein
MMTTIPSRPATAQTSTLSSSKEKMDLGIMEEDPSVRNKVRPRRAIDSMPAVLTTREVT